MKQIYSLYNFKYHSFYNSILAFLFFFFPWKLKKSGSGVGLFEPVKSQKRCIFYLSFRIKGMNHEDP